MEEIILKTNDLTVGFKVKNKLFGKPGRLSAGHKVNLELRRGEFSMTWNFIIAFREDERFTLTNDTGEEKGAGTYALTDTCYTMT